MSWTITPAYIGAAVSDPDAQTYLRAVEAADGQALEQGVQQAVNQFVIGCKADGIWTAIKASCILAGARTLTGALVPLAGTAPTNVNFVSGDYNRKTGLLGNGSTKYLNSNRNNNADPQNSKHLAVYATVLSTVTNQAYALTTYGVGFTALNVVNASTVSLNINADSGAVVTPNTLGFIGSQRSASNVQQGRTGGSTYQNGTASQSPRNDTIKLIQFSFRLAFYSIGESLDLALLDSRVTALVTAFATAIP
jgi:hypothetical protein